jgi:hypothetical protein
VEIERLRWLPANEDKLRQHGVSREEVDAMIRRDEWVVLMHPAYPDQVRVIGPTATGQLITVAMEPTDDPVEWRPITGWDAAPSERAYYWEEYR